MKRLVGQVQKLPEDAWPKMRAHWSRPKSFLAQADHLASLRRSALEIAAVKPIRDTTLVVLTAEPVLAAVPASLLLRVVLGRLGGA